MGYIEINVRQIVEKRLVLTQEDLELRMRRRELWQDAQRRPRLFGWHERFTAELEHCPFCGKPPKMRATWSQQDGYDYKFVCDCYFMDCGDWYGQLSYAGLDWNYRARKEKGEPRRHAKHIAVKCDAYGRPVTLPF